jgi:hypothetical protein
MAFYGKLWSEKCVRQRRDLRSKTYLVESHGGKVTKEGGAER